MSSRLHRISTLLKKELADILRRKVNDSKIGFISITDIELSPDLSHAWVHYSQIGNEEARAQTKKALQRATSFIRYEVGKAISHLPQVPKLHFKYDESLEKGSNIVSRMQKLEK